jgi:hypothetical protein
MSGQFVSGVIGYAAAVKAANLCYPNNERSTIVSEPTVAEATDCIYASLQSDNADIDTHIATLKAALTREGLKEAVFDPTNSHRTTVQGAS